MSRDMQDSYKRKLKALLVSILFLLGVCMVRENKRMEMFKVNEKPESVGKITQTYTYVEEYTEPVQYVYDEEMYSDERYVYQEEEKGSKSITVMAVYQEGEQTEQKILDTEIIQKANPEIIYVGIKERPTYIYPVEDYCISSYFGPRWGRSHKGIDLAVCTGTRVEASRAGEVVRAEWYGGYGYCVDVEHEDGVVTRYGHLSEICVEIGQEVSQGNLLAYSGNTGNSTGPHLHFEIIVDGCALNPMLYLPE